MGTPKEKRDFIASRNILQANVRLFHDGNRDVYRVVAGELRKLLCDRPKPLATRLFPSAALHPTLSYRPGEDTSALVVQVPAHIEFDESGAVRVVRIFNESRTPLPLDEWLEQPFLNEGISLRVFIKSVADKEAAHADPDFNAALLAAMRVKLGAEDCLGLLIVAIGEYVLGVLDMAIRHNAMALGVTNPPS